MMGGGYGMAGGFGFGGIFMIVWWILLIVAVVGLVKWLAGSFGSGSRRDSSKALDILKERYARGEIDEQEYQKRKRDLSD